jgi:hypothetical protein
MQKNKQANTMSNNLQAMAFNKKQNKLTGQAALKQAQFNAM